MAEQSTPEPLVIFMPSGRRGRVPAGTLVLDAARQLGVEIESICGGRLTCNKCRIRVEEGQFAKHGIRSAESHLSPASEDEIHLLEKLESLDCRLSCNAKILDDALIFVPEESRAHKQVVRKAATERVIDLKPAVRQVFVAVDHAELGEHRGDWGRLQDALAAEWELHNLTIDFPVLRQLQANLRKGKWNVTVTLWQEREVIDVQPGYQEGVYGLAVDIGSTTIAGFLCDLRTGKILATESMMNPQVTYGEDLMSRVSYAMMHNDGLEKMHTAVIDALNRVAASTAREAGIRQRHIQEAVFVGNTTMMHILLGISPVELGGAPFALANRDGIDVKARELGLRLHPGANVHVLPAEAGHVGADNVAALIAEAPYNHEDVTLLVDVGTNAEIGLGNKDWMLSASSPTGPAFEGAQIRFGMRAAPGAIERVRIDPNSLVANFRVIGEENWSDTWQIGPEYPAEMQPKHLAAGICGSGIIEVVAEMFLTGVLLPDGRFNPNLSSVNSNQSSVNSDRVRWDGRRGEYILATAEQTTTGSPIVVTQDDVRSIQLAKAALYAGVKLLMNQAKLTSVDRIVLAGAFGSYIDPKYAMILGLIPDCDLEKVTAVGNAAGDGARIALLNRHKRAEAQHVAEWVTYVETAVHPDFQQEFVGAIHIPHASDHFPHLMGILPEQQPNLDMNGNGRSGRKRRRRTRKG
ncbi:MAG: ferredoxin [Ardenticatenaceae bacterium]|nr:MAG: ferredoxin [Ardenticatenaceae bacterium]